MLYPCAREIKARTGRFLREELISDHGLFSSYEDQQGAANRQDSWGFFRDAQSFGRLNAGSRASFTSKHGPNRKHGKWCPCVTINVSVQYNGGLLPDIILLIQCYYL